MEGVESLSFNALLHERASAMSLLQEELNQMTVASDGKSTLTQMLDLVTLEDMTSVTSAGSIEEVEIALMQIDRVCRQRRTEKLGQDNRTWKAIRSKYNIIGVCM